MPSKTMPSKTKYILLGDYPLKYDRGAAAEPGDELELDPRVAAPLVEQGRLRLADVPSKDKK